MAKIEVGTPKLVGSVNDPAFKPAAAPKLAEDRVSEVPPSVPVDVVEPNRLWAFLSPRVVFSNACGTSMYLSPDLTMTYFCLDLASASAAVPDAPPAGNVFVLVLGAILIWGVDLASGVLEKRDLCVVPSVGVASKLLAPMAAAGLACCSAAGPRRFFKLGDSA